MANGVVNQSIDSVGDDYLTIALYCVRCYPIKSYAKFVLNGQSLCDKCMEIEHAKLPV